jgi:hypothetical protein
MPRGSIYCHRFEAAWPAEAEIIDQAHVLLCRRRGAAIDLVLDRVGCVNTIPLQMATFAERGQVCATPHLDQAREEIAHLHRDLPPPPALRPPLPDPGGGQETWEDGQRRRLCGAA